MTHPVVTIKHVTLRQAWQACRVAMIVKLDDGPGEALSG